MLVLDGQATTWICGRLCCPGGSAGLERFKVSHDRFLIERVTDGQYALIDSPPIRHVPGGVDEYLQAVDAAKQTAKSGELSGTRSSSDSNEPQVNGSSRQEGAVLVTLSGAKMKSALIRLSVAWARNSGYLKAGSRQMSCDATNAQRVWWSCNGSLMTQKRR